MDDKRIKELSERAVTILSERARDHGEILEASEWNAAWHQKFAELVIADCLTICNCVGETEAAGRTCAEMIRENFGVK